MLSSDDGEGCSGRAEHGSFPMGPQKLYPQGAKPAWGGPGTPALGLGCISSQLPASQDSSRRPCFRWKENNGKNKSKDHSDWKSIATLKHNNCNHIYWPSGRVRTHRQDHQLRWIAIAPLTLPLHTWSCPVFTKWPWNIYFFFLLLHKTPQPFQKWLLLYSLHFTYFTPHCNSFPSLISI